MKIICAQENDMISWCFFTKNKKIPYISCQLDIDHTDNRPLKTYKIKKKFITENGFELPKGSVVLKWIGHTFGLDQNGEIPLMIPIVTEKDVICIGEDLEKFILCVPNYIIK